MHNSIHIILEAEQLEGTQAIVSNWLVEVGEQVSLNQPIVELETDKVAIEVTATTSGTLQSITANSGDKVVAGDLLATLNPITTTSSTLKTNSNVNSTTEKPIQSELAQQANQVQTGSIELSKSKKHLLGPAVKKLLSQHTLEPADIQGTGQDGRISKKDVLLHIEEHAKQPVHSNLNSTMSSTFIPHTAMRNSIAKHMVDSLLNTSPHVTSIFEMDMSAIIAHRAARKLGYLDAEVNLTFTAYFLAASAIAIKEVPQINSQFHADGLEIFDQINIGVGTALKDSGLVVPVVENVAEKSLFQLASKLTEQTDKARNRKLTGKDMQGGTFTISNYGVSGSLVATPIIINQPQVAILGVGKLEKRVTVETIEGEDTMVIKSMCYVSLSIDHRALDAYQTNAFLAKFVSTIENWGKDENTK